MGFAQTLKRVFGFDSAEMEEEELEGIDARVTPLRERRDPAVAQLQAASAGVPPTESSVPAEVCETSHTADHSTADSTGPQAIFASVVKIFNQSLPEFLQQTVDEQQQRNFLYNALDSSLKQYLENLAADAERKCAERFEAERNSLLERIDSLEQKIKKEESGSSETKKAQLSAERQKRAVTERMHELEKQLAQLQAENEQYTLENKSLLNKLRLTALAPGAAAGDDADLIAAKITELEQQIVAQKQLTENADREAKENLAALSAARHKISKLADEAAEAEQLRQQLAQATADLEALNQLKENIEKLEANFAANEAERARRSEAESELNQTIDNLNREKQQLTDDLAESRANVQELERTNSELRKTIDDNLYEHKQAESVLRAEIERLTTAQPVAAQPYTEPGGTTPEAAEDIADLVVIPASDSSQQSDAPTSEYKPRKKRGRKPKLRISAIDSSLEDTDWFVATPPERSTTNGTAEENPEFGYREPQRHQTPDHPAQMSLW